MGRRRDSTATGRGTARSLCCWTWDGENLLLLDRDVEKPLLLNRIYNFRVEREADGCYVIHVYLKFNIAIEIIVPVIL